MDAYSPSLLDKLLAPDHEGREGVRLQYSKDRIKDSVARDIEMILNNHATKFETGIEAMPNVSKSFLTIGLVDIASMSISSDKDRARITESIRRALANHDKRLSQVEVKVSQATSEGLSRQVFSIKANLILRPDIEPVSFDAVLRPGSTRYEVSKSDRRRLA